MNPIKRFFYKQAYKYIASQKGIKHYGNFDILRNNVHFYGANDQVYIRDGFLKNHHVYSVITKIARECSKAEFNLYRINTRKGKKKLKGGFSPAKEDAELVEQHDIYDILDRPNPSEGKRQFIEGAMGFKLSTGEYMIHKIAPQNGANKGIPRRLYLLPPQITNVETFEDDITPKSFDLKNGVTEQDKIPASQVIFGKYFNPESSNRHRGLSPIRAGLGSVQRSNDANFANLKLLQNVGPPGILSLDDSNAAAIGQSETDQVKEKLKESHSGAENYGDYVVTSLKFKWEQMGMSAQDLDLLETDKVALREICNIFGITSYLFNDAEGSTYNNMREARKDLISQKVIPEMQSFVSQLNEHLVPFYEERDGVQYMLTLDESVWPEIQEDMEKQVNILEKAWWLSPNERRLAMGHEEAENDAMNDIWTPTNLIPAGSGSDPTKSLENLYSRYYQNNG